MKRLASCLLAVLFGATLLSLPVYGEEARKDKGLFITPLRQYVTVQAGQPKEGRFSVANLTAKPITATLSVQQFSVADYSYDYQFSDPKGNWIHFSEGSVELQPGASKTIAYTINPPKDASLGGEYFTLLATSDMGGGAIKNKVQVATVLYVTVEGKLQYKSTIEQEKTPWISFGGDIPVSFVVNSKSNSHFFAYISGKAEGWLGSTTGQEVTHIILPGAKRTVEQTIPAPLLPGVYKVTYGYGSDKNTAASSSRYIVNIPLWSLAALVGGIWLTVLIRRRFFQQ